MKVALAFDDVLLVPQYNEVASRKDVDTSMKLSKHITLEIPVISSCMDTVTDAEMAIEMFRAGGLGILHRYNTIQQQVDMFLIVQRGRKKGEELLLFDRPSQANCAIAIGSVGDYMERATNLVDVGANVLCVDVAHGDSLVVIEATKRLRKTFPHITLIAGNVATGEGCARLIDAGADAIRAGIGSGSTCSTRVITASGLPTLQTVFDCREYLEKHGYTGYCILADGGIKIPGDLVKSIAAGAGGVILGQLLAATDESPGEVVETSKGKFKKYRGMSSYGAQSDWRPEKKDDIVPEGEETMLPYKGSARKIIHDLIGGLRSGMTYSGAKTLTELQQKAQFVQITNAGWAESKPHAKKD